MAYQVERNGKTYTLYKNEITLKNPDTPQTVYFFARGQPKSGEPADKPDGWEVTFSKRSGLPFLKKK